MADNPRRLRSRPLPIGPLRAFEAVARLGGFRAAGDALHLTQPAISRQVKALEDALGAAVFVRGARGVELTQAGQTLLRALLPMLERLDGAVRQIRSTGARRRVSVTTFASFASLWLLPRLPAFQREHPDIDIRILASDGMADWDDPEIDLALRHCRPATLPGGPDDHALLFGEVLTPVASPHLGAIASAAELARHTLLDEEDDSASAEAFGWRHWLALHGQPRLEPRGWVTVNYTHQKVQAALAGQGVALARLALSVDALARGELVEPFGAAGRLCTDFAYFLLRWPQGRERPERLAFEQWLLREAALTRQAVDALQAAAPGARG